MPKGVRKCKVCGAEYPYCQTPRRDNAFRYQDVACCPEHGSIYFDRIAASRSGSASKLEADQSTTSKSKKKASKKKTKATQVVEDIVLEETEDEDVESEDDLDDSEEEE